MHLGIQAKNVSCLTSFETTLLIILPTLQRGLAEYLDVNRLEADGLQFADQVFDELRSGASNRRLAIKNCTNRDL